MLQYFTLRKCTVCCRLNSACGMLPLDQGTVADYKHSIPSIKCTKLMVFTCNHGKARISIGALPFLMPFLCVSHNFGHKLLMIHVKVQSLYRDTLAKEVMLISYAPTILLDEVRPGLG